MNIYENLVALETSLTSDEGLSYDRIWRSDILHWTPQFSENQIKKVEQLEVKIPDAYLKLVCEHGAFSFASEDASFENGRCRLMLPDEIVKNTTFWRKEMDFKNYGFESPLADELNSILRSGFFFQYVITNGYSDFYFLCDDDRIRLWEDDDLNSFCEPIANNFTEHMEQLIAQWKS